MIPVRAYVVYTLYIPKIDVLIHLYLYLYRVCTFSLFFDPILSHEKLCQYHLKYGIIFSIPLLGILLKAKVVFLQSWNYNTTFSSSGGGWVLAGIRICKGGECVRFLPIATYSGCVIFYVLHKKALKHSSI